MPEPLESEMVSPTPKPTPKRSAWEALWHGGGHWARQRQVAVDVAFRACCVLQAGPSQRV